MTSLCATEYFDFNPDLRILVCTTCTYAVWPGQARGHLTSAHHGLSLKQARVVVADIKRWPNLCSDPAEFELPRAVQKPVPGLPIYSDGLRCLLDATTCQYICRNESGLRSHWSTIHQWSIAEGRKGGSGRSRHEAYAKRKAASAQSVCCQRLFHAGIHSQYFEVLPTVLADDDDASQAHAQSGVANAVSELRALRQERKRDGELVSAAGSVKEVSPWLQLTRWPNYLQGHKLPQVAALARLPTADDDPVLAVLCECLDELVEAAYQSVCNDRVNAFDQERINSFLQRPRAADQPLMVKLQKSTYRTYKSIWKSLLCFVYRTALREHSTSLRHRFSTLQLASLDRAVHAAEHLIQTRLEPESEKSKQSLFQTWTVDGRTQQCCLDLCIALLDHEIKGDLFENVVVGFFAVIAIDVEKGMLREAYHYTPTLSGFIKIAQMLVLQKAVVATDLGDIDHPADLIDEMRERFMVHGTRSPFSWASRLRTYGKKVRDSTTCLGYIEWSEDGERVSYKGIRNLNMGKFRTFIRAQVAKAQGQLEALLLVHPDERREDLGIHFWMHRLVDNAAENRKEWNFLQDEANRSGPLPDRQTGCLSGCSAMSGSEKSSTVGSGRERCYGSDLPCGRTKRR